MFFDFGFGVIGVLIVLVALLAASIRVLRVRRTVALPLVAEMAMVLRTGHRLTRWRLTMTVQATLRVPMAPMVAICLWAANPYCRRLRQAAG